MDERKSRSIAIVLVILMCISIIAVVILLIIIFSTDRVNSDPLILSLRIIGPFTFVALSGLFVIIAQSVKKRREERYHQTEYDDLIQDVEESEKPKKSIKLVLEPKVFRGDREKQTCEICRKPIKEGHIVIECPRCASLFHHDHILDWLRKNPLCPVCKEDL